MTLDKYRFAAHFQTDADNPNLWEVRIPGLDGTEEGPVTCGDDLKDARRMASGLIDSWFVTCLKNGQNLPTPGPLPKGEGWEWVTPSLRMLFVLALRARRKEIGISQAQAARQMGFAQPVYARLEDPVKANPTLETVQRAKDNLGVDVFSIA